MPSVVNQIENKNVYLIILCVDKAHKIIHTVESNIERLEKKHINHVHKRAGLKER